MNLGLASKLSIAGLILFILAGSLSSRSFFVPATGEANTEHYVLVTKWGSLGTANGRFSGVEGIGVDALGHMYVVDRGNDRIEKFDSNGTFITAWGSPGTANGQLNNIRDIAVYPCGSNLYVADTGNNRIQMFYTNGKFLREWGSNGTASGQFHYPEGVGVDSRQGNVYVADTGNNRIQMFDDYGKFITA
jgi:tripartite motif-containing protein 71